MRLTLNNHAKNPLGSVQCKKLMKSGCHVTTENQVHTNEPQPIEVRELNSADLVSRCRSESLMHARTHILHLEAADEGESQTREGPNPPVFASEGVTCEGPNKRKSVNVFAMVADMFTLAMT